MKDPVRITLLPLAVSFDVERGTPLQDILFDYGVEFPCGGKAQCEGCKVKVLSGSVAVVSGQEYVLTQDEIAEGWRLSCCCRTEVDVTLELAQWDIEVLADDSKLEANDALAIDIMRSNSVTEILTFDEDFDRVDGITKVPKPT